MDRSSLSGCSPANVSQCISDRARGCFTAENVAQIFARDTVAGDVGEVSLPAVVSANSPDADRVNGKLVQERAVLGIYQTQHRVVQVHPKVLALDEFMMLGIIFFYID